VPALRPDERLTIVELPFDRPSPVEDGASAHSAVAAIRKSFPSAKHLAISVDDLNARRFPSLSRLNGTVLLLTRDDARFPWLAPLAAALAKRAAVFHVALRNPHDLAASAGIARARIAAYSDTPPTLEVLASRILTGAAWRGRLPVHASWITADSTQDLVISDEAAA
jgi:hypothetical protein